MQMRRSSNSMLMALMSDSLFDVTRGSSTSNGCRAQIQAQSATRCARPQRAAPFLTVGSERTSNWEIAMSTNGSRIAFEMLERRSHLSAVVDGTVLLVTGSDEDDEITVENNADDSSKVDITENGE